MSITFLPDWFGANPTPPPNEYQPSPRYNVCRDTGAVRYLRDWRTGLVFWFCEFGKPGQQLGLGFLAEQLDANPADVNRRLAVLVERGEIRRENVINAQSVNCDVFALTDLGRQRQADYNAKIADD